jgi:hypothetical protein
MNARIMRAGIAGGIAGGMVMAAFSMIAMWLAGSGFWTPLNLIAHTFWRAAPLDGTFSAAALVIGVGVHMTMAILVGTLIAAAAGPAWPAEGRAGADRPGAGSAGPVGAAGHVGAGAGAAREDRAGLRRGQGQQGGRG